METPCQKKYKEVSKKLFILPIRNGNERILDADGDTAAWYPFYPTYKEWKQSSFITCFICSITFYPTYKEWKLQRYTRLS